MLGSLENARLSSPEISRPRARQEETTWGSVRAMPAINHLIHALLPPSKPDAFDLRHGVDTAGHVPRWRLLLSSINARHGTRYQPIGETELSTALDFIGEDLRAFSFVDLGCGKGRALVIAEQYGFQHVIGVEYNKSLAEIAKRNAGRSTVIHGDAADFILPKGKVALFLYNPFSSKIMTRVVERITVHCGPLYVLYNKPACAGLFDGSDALVSLGQIPGTPSFYAWKKL